MASQKPTETPPVHAAIVAKADALESAKRRAAASFTHMMASTADQQQYEQATKATTRDELDVLRARVDVLNTLMRHPDARLCLPAEDRKPRVCVTYDRLRCEGELQLGPMQSTMAWAVRGAEDPVLQLMSASDSAGHAPVVKALLQLVQQSAPRKDVLAGLQAVLALPPPERLLLKSLAGACAGHTRVFEGLGEAREQACAGHTRVFEGLGEAAGVPPLYRVVWGALDLDVLEGWQNPSTNTAIRLSILDTAHQAAREAQQTKAPAWSNVAHLQVRIYHDDECHVLSLHPFWDSESCTVSHLQYRQSVFDDSGPERGILNLSPDAASIHPIPLGKILPIQAFVCLGAHRKSRLSEPQLNFVHAQGLLAHGLNPDHLPDAGTLLAATGKMCPARATRVSGEKLDIMASSYHVADQVYTTISVVQYPPFGTQFQRVLPVQRAINMRRLGMEKPVPDPGHWEDREPVADWGGDQDPAPATDAPDAEWEAWRDRQMQPDEEGSSDGGSQPGPAPPPPARKPWEPRRAEQPERRVPGPNDWTVHEYGRAKSGKLHNRRGLPHERSSTPRKHPTEEPLYKIGRDFASDCIPRSVDESRAQARPLNWVFQLRKGEHYFVDRVAGDPYDLSKRFVLFELDGGMRFREAEANAAEIKSFFKENRTGVFLSAYPFYWNISQNHNVMIMGEHTLAQTWQNQWQHYIRTQLGALLEEIHATGGSPKWFWCTEDLSLWDQIIPVGSPAASYPEFSRRYYNRLLNEGRIQCPFTRPTPCLAPTDPLPLPQTRLSARSKAGSDPAVAQLQSRISALESRLSRVRQGDNTQHLLEQVLERLDTPEVD